MPAYTRNDVRKALELEQDIRDAVDGDVRALADARIAALRRILKQAPDDEVFEAAH